MSSVERTTSWQQIQQGVKEAERLMARKEYNLVMVRARQVLEYMVRCMAERACLVEGDLSDTIDQLYEGRWINKGTKDNYHTIRILGNKAVHEGDDAAYDANQAFQLLTQEVYVFANEFTGGHTSRPAAGARAASARQAPRQGSSGARSASGRNSQRNPSRTAPRSGSSRQAGQRKKKRRRVSPVVYIWRLLIPVLVIILLVVVIKVLMPGKEKEADKTTAAPTVTTAPAEPAPTPAPEPETEPETEPPVESYRIKGNSVNVRSEPSTSGRILVQLSNGTEVVYVKRYDNDWAVINYDGQEAYVSSKFIEKVEPGAETPALTATQTTAVETTAAN